MEKSIIDQMTTEELKQYIIHSEELREANTDLVRVLQNLSSDLQTLYNDAMNLKEAQIAYIDRLSIINSIEYEMMQKYSRKDDNVKYYDSPTDKDDAELIAEKF